MLLAEGISAGYGRMTVLRNVTLSVEPGEIVLVLGPNGAGKSTLMKALSGLLPLQGGALRVGDEDLTGLNAERLSRRGIRHVLEGHRVFPELTVQENLRLGQLALPRGQRLPDDEVIERASETFPFLGEKRRLLAQSLSGGQQQMLALAQAWAARPDFLLCDEPSLGLAQSLVPDILSFFRDRAREGMGVLLVEQLVDQPLSVADRVVVLRQGVIVAEGKTADFANRTALTELMLGVGAQ